MTFPVDTSRPPIKVMWLLITAMAAPCCRSGSVLQVLHYTETSGCVQPVWPPKLLQNFNTLLLTGNTHRTTQKLHSNSLFNHTAIITILYYTYSYVYSIHTKSTIMQWTYSQVCMQQQRQRTETPEITLQLAIKPHVCTSFPLAINGLMHALTFSPSTMDSNWVWIVTMSGRPFGLSFKQESISGFRGWFSSSLERYSLRRTISLTIPYT